jgi:hypothetical protein
MVEESVLSGVNPEPVGKQASWSDTPSCLFFSRTAPGGDRLKSSCTHTGINTHNIHTQKKFEKGLDKLDNWEFRGRI